MQRQVRIQMQHERDHVRRRQRRGRHRVAEHPQVRAISLEYTAAMPIDVAARVIANRPLSSDYNVLALAAPAIAAAAAPGQFVMVKAGRRRRSAAAPSVFGLRDPARRRAAPPTGLSILSKRIGVSTSLLYDARDGPARSTASDRSAVRSPSSIRRPRRGWSPAASASRRSRRSRRRCARAASKSTLFYGARRAAELFYLDFFRELGVELVLTTEDGSLGERGRVVAPLDRRLAALPPAAAGDALRVRTGRHAGRHGAHGDEVRPAVPGVGRADHGLRPRRLLQLRRADARRRRRVSSRPIVHRGTGAARRIRYRGTESDLCVLGVLGVGSPLIWISRFRSARSPSRTR